MFCGSLATVISKSVEVSHRGTSESKPLSGKTAAPQSVELPGLTWVGNVMPALAHTSCLFYSDSNNEAYVPLSLQPAGNHIIVKIIWAIQWPFSLLRWLTIPPFCPPVSS